MKVAVVGAGLVGSAWAIVFARAGCEVTIFDAVDGGTTRSVGIIRDRLQTLERVGLVDDAGAIQARIQVATSLSDAVAGTEYIQESVFETV